MGSTSFKFIGGVILAEAVGKLERDVKIMAAMAAEMDAYLNSDVLFWHMSLSGMPTLTLGGYLMRQHRLLVLRHLLDEAVQATLDSAIQQYNGVLVEKIIRFEQKAHRELEARLRQWGEYLYEIDRGTAAKASNYETAVETRVMIDAIVEPLQLAPYKLDGRIPSQIALLDSQLKRVWQSGDFVWFDDWQPAYPPDDFWWLYGEPRKV
jgi:hypothetical protein